MDGMLNFIGSVDSFPKDVGYGDLVVLAGSDNPYVFVNNKWIQLCDNERDTETKDRITVCPHCGASVDPYIRKCAYCGSYIG